MKPSRGIALLLVLWLLVLITGLVSAFSLTARVEGMQGQWLGRSVAARLAAESGIELAASRLGTQEPARRWFADGRPYSFSFDGWRVRVRIQDEAGKLDLNAISPNVMAGLLVQLGEDQARAEQLTAAINDWHDDDNLLSAGIGAEDPQYASEGLPYGAKDRPFELVSELRLVLGITPALYRKLEPYVTVYTGMNQPEPSNAPALVLRALGQDATRVAEIEVQRAAATPATLAGAGSGTYSISSEAVRPDGARAAIHAVVRVGGNGNAGQLYTPLAWHVGDRD
jgi:general secretion pathway protein K